MLEEEKATEYPCTNCGRVSKTSLAFTRHVNKCKATNLQCTLCKASFNDHDLLKDHIQTVHKGKCFVCSTPSCMATYTTKKGLNYHESTAHTVKTFECVPCSEIFDSIDELNSHKKTKEHRNKALQTPCKGCGRIFRGTHESTQHWDNSCPFNPNRVVKCYVCKVETGQAKDFLVHLKENHNSKSSQLCTRCLLDFSSKTKLEKHQETCKKGG